MRLWGVVLCALLAYLQYQFWQGKNGYQDFRYYQQAVAQLSQEQQFKMERNKQMFAQIRDLKENTDAVEEQARAEYGMVKSDEVFYRLVREE